MSMVVGAGNDIMAKSHSFVIFQCNGMCLVHLRITLVWWRRKVCLSLPPEFVS
jgi:hypothetical protein